MTARRPTLDELNARSQAEIEGKLAGAEARLFATPEYVLAQVSAGHAHGMYGRVERAERQLFPATMDDEFIDASLKIWKVSDGAGGYGRIKAAKATGKATFTGSSGAAMPTGREVKIGEQVYTIDVGYTYPAASEDHIFDITAKAPGADSNADAGATVSLVSAIANIETDGTVTGGGLTDGAAQETLAAAKVRLEQAIRTPGAGGARGDYVPLAKAVSALVTEAWELPRQNGQGTMLVLVANDNEDPPDADATLTAAVLAALQSTDADGFITGTAPTSAILTVGSVFTQALEVTASITLDTGAIWEDSDGEGVRKDVETEIAALIMNVRKPGVTVTTEEISGAIQRAAGVKSHTLTAPAADVTHTALQIPYAGTHTLTQA